ncbi:hypothetical protein BH18ACT1_BH18ACT1_00430 [soil metagenome]
MLAALTALALPVLLGACSEDETLSKEEFIEQGDRICDRADDRQNELEAPEDLEAAVAFFDEVDQITDRARTDFADLQPPEDGEDLQQRFVDQVDEGQDRLDEVRAAAEDGDEDRFQQLISELEDNFGAETNEALRDYGFEQCGEEDE